MSARPTGPAALWRQVGTRFLPFADAASDALPLGRLMRLSLFQVTVGMATALLVGTLNRVMIVELGLSAALVSLMVALPILAAPFRALIGFRSDHHVSALGWKRVPYIWFGTLMQFGGFAFMPFALLVLSSDHPQAGTIGALAAGMAFLLVGAGLQTVQTAGLALATDLAREEDRPRVVALMYVMLLVGLVVSSLVFGWVLSDFSEIRLIQVIQGAAATTMVLNLVALWKQEARDPARTRRDRATPGFGATLRAFAARPGARRFLLAVGLGTGAFAMQDVVLEPYGGQILGLPVGSTTQLTALAALGALAAFALAARRLDRGADPMRLAGLGAALGLPAFAAVALAAPTGSADLFRLGTLLIGFGGGLFAVGTLTAAMGLEAETHTGLALGAWGAVQATAAGLGVAVGGILRDAVAGAADAGLLGAAVAGPASGYAAVYLVELVMLLATLVAVGPLARYGAASGPSGRTRFGLAEMPG